ncbi:MAG TPA: adenylate/guanylate cyclase domain-containing protein [Candidatus Tectomicrobia bacterium]|nr:adenylate/guanylate cyclase domain-containing protein [Candidatus Tectomicrobia bacterium]
MRCPSCSLDNPEAMTFCGACGAPLPLRCSQCGAENPPRFKFCGACGTPLNGQPRATQAAGTDAPRDAEATPPPRGIRSGAARPRPEAERRQLTVLFCDLVESTSLATHLDPEELREVIRAYHAVCARVIERFEGHIAQYLGDGVLVYFGYPRAHEDDAQRAVRAGLGIIEALRPLQQRLQQGQGVGLAVRVGIHTGLVVVGEIGEGSRPERLALGEVPNLAARLQGLTPANTVLISASTARLVQGWFVCEALDEQTLKGFPEPMTVYRVVAESGVQSRLDLGGIGGLTPLVGREQELKFLVERWEQAAEGLGQVVVLRGEAGIGKSRLLRALQERLAGQPYTRLECRGSPYAQHSALYPVIDLGRRLLQWQRDELPDVTLEKLEAALAPYDVALPEVMPLLAALLSLPHSERYAPLQLTPERQKQKTFEAILALWRAHAARQPLLFIVEDLHWIDPSTLELLTLLIDQAPTGHILALLTCRPGFQPPWPFGGQVISLTLDRLPPTQVELMIDQITGGKRLPAEVRQQVVAQTDGVPLFVEELTKMVLESGLLREQADRFELRGPLHALAIPTTLHDSLMARLDRLGEAKEVAQLAATLGRTFVYELLQAVSPWDEERLQQALEQLVRAELLHQQGILPQVTYTFKHALIQETAYQSLLRSTRQHYHRRTVRILEQRFPDVVETQPELLAYHYTEASLPTQAVPYWQRAGQLAIERSANHEAVDHLTKGLQVVKTLPDTPARTRQELELQLALGSVLRMVKGHTAPDVEHTYTRAYELSQQMGDSPQRFAPLMSLWRFYLNQAKLQTAQELADQCFALAQHVLDPEALQDAHRMLGATSLFRGEPAAARVHLERGIALDDAQGGRQRALSGGMDHGVTCRSYAAWALWLLGYPEQALTKMHDALTLASELSHAFSLAFALNYAAMLHAWRREVHLAKERAEAVITLSNEHAFIHAMSVGMIRRGWTLAKQGAVAEGIGHLHQGLATLRDIGTELALPQHLALLAEAYRQGGQVGEALRVLAGAMAHVDKTEERCLEAELYRLKGECLLAWASQRRTESEAEACFRQALDIARRQKAKSLELRAAISLGRLWHQQGKRAEARALLTQVYDWFTEGFDTPDLRDARALLDMLP